MKPKNNIEKFIKQTYHANLPDEPRAEMDRRILSNILELQKNLKTTIPTPSIWKTITKTRSLKIAVAAVLIIAARILVVHHRPGEQIEKQSIKKYVQKTPAPTAMSYRLAYRRGGLEAMEQLSRQTSKRLQPRATRLTVQKLMMELDEETERKEL